MAGPKYDQSHVGSHDVIARHMERPYRMGLERVENRCEHLRQRLNEAAAFDQYPGRRFPQNFSLLYPVGLRTARRRSGGTGHEANATLVDLAERITPRDGDIVIDRDGPWYWTRTNAVAYSSLTYTGAPGNGGIVFNDAAGALPAGELFASVLGENGGAETLNWFFSHVDYQEKPNISFDVEIRDAGRNRKLHEKNLPPQVFTAQNFANKLNASWGRFEPGTKISFRVRPLEVRMGSLLDTDQAYNNHTFSGWVAIVLFGYKVLDV